MMIIVASWKDWLVDTRIYKFADSAQAQGYVDSMPNEYTAYQFDTDAEGGLEVAVSTMCQGRTAQSVLELYNALDRNAEPIKSFHDKETARRRIGLRLLERADKGALMQFAPANKLVNTPDGRMPAMRRDKTTQTSRKGGSSGRPGVIQSLIELLKDGGGTVQELYEQLAKIYPERGPGMKVTAGIQVKRLHTSGKLAIKKEKIEGRGTVYSSL